MAHRRLGKVRSAPLRLPWITSHESCGNHDKCDRPHASRRPGKVRAVAERELSAMPYRGECHCGAIGYEYRTEVAPQRWPIRACQCAFCRMHGARTTSDPLGHVDFNFREPNCLRRYRFGLRTADFLLCGRCGGYLGATTVIAAGSFAVINVNLLRPYLQGLGTAEPMSYEGETAEERARRRSQRWTPCAGLPGGG
jgi:hypothetical protein